MYAGFLCDKVAVSDVAIEVCVCTVSDSYVTVDSAGQVAVKGLQCKW